MRVPLMISGAIGMVVFGLSYMTVDAGTGVDFTALNSLEKDFEVAFGDAASWSSKGGVIQCTGSPNGYIVTKKSYSNYYRNVQSIDLILCNLGMKHSFLVQKKGQLHEQRLRLKLFFLYNAMDLNIL